MKQKLAEKKTYSNESITSLNPIEAIRYRPEVMLGSSDINGCIHAVFEIISNSVDEARSGFGNRINFTIHKDNSLTVEDFGRGIPLDWNKAEKRYNYELLYTEMYSGSKYNGDIYSYSLGLNGLGAMACQCSSAWFDVESRRDGNIYNMHFEKGKPAAELSILKDKSKPQLTGTIQTWLPDIEVFTDINIPKDVVIEMLKTQAVVNAGLTINFTDERDDTKETYVYPEGIKGYVTELSEGALTEPYIFNGEGKGRDREDKPEYSVKAEVAFCFDNNNQTLKYFHNSSFLEHGGSPDKATRSALVSAFDKELKRLNKYNSREAKIQFQDIEDSLIWVVNSMSTQTSYENQTKKAINNKFIQEFLTELIKSNMQVWFIEHQQEAEKVFNQILINKRSREQSESQRVTVKKKLMEKTDVTNKVKKFIDCRSKNPEEREIFINEGDSAAGSLLVARNPEYQAIMPLRGKILNIQKASLQSIFNSEIIMDLIRVLGCGIEIKGKKMPKDIPQFDDSRLKFNKVIIMADMDVDGDHIVTLVTTMIHRLCPKLIEEGHLYYAMTPLFEITDNTGRKPKTLYAFSDAERDKLINGKDPKKIKIQRSKGLGENTPEVMSLFMARETRRLIKITSTDAKEMEAAFELFMGNDIAPRKAYIEEHGHEYMDDLDID